MIYAFAAELPALLKLKKRSVPVIYGPLAHEQQPDCTAIVIMRDGENDSWAPNRMPGANGNRPEVELRGRYVASRVIAGVARLYAQSTKPKATRWEHEELADDMADAVYCASIRWTNGNARDGQSRNVPVVWQSGRIVPKDELPGVYDRFTGVLYEMNFTIQRAVFDSDASGLGYPVAEIERVTTTGKVNGATVDTITAPEPEPETPDPEPEPDP